MEPVFIDSYDWEDDDDTLDGILCVDLTNGDQVTYDYDTGKVKAWLLIGGTGPGHELHDIGAMTLPNSDQKMLADLLTMYLKFMSE